MKGRELTEAQLKRQIEDYLDILQNQCKIVWLRLNAGDNFRPGKEGKLYRVKGCPKGTSDLCIIKDGKAIFVELKSYKGKVTPEQYSFAERVQACGAQWYVVKLFQELEGILGVL